MDRGLTEKLFQNYSRLVYEKSGICLRDEKKALLQARLNKRLRATGFASYDEYFKFITAPENARELTHFIDCISTNLTYFFREPQHFDFLDQVLPDLLERRRKSRDFRLRVWSAGCSTGEEPYSLAMCVLEHLQDPTRWDFRVLATDISTRVLETAFKGVYSKDKVEKVPPKLRHQYFRKVAGKNGEQDYEVDDKLKKLVAFRRLNLQQEYPFKGPFDFIFCRNVMIYFDKQTQERLIVKMSAYMSAGGYLFVGHSESLTGLAHPLTYVRPAVYRK
jgi:chemotaxis protein methyltransferase CheR